MSYYILRSTAFGADLAAHMILGRACQKYINSIFGKNTWMNDVLFDDTWSITWMNIWHHINWSILIKSESQSGLWFWLEQPAIILTDLDFISIFRTDYWTDYCIFCVLKLWQIFWTDKDPKNLSLKIERNNEKRKWGNYVLYFQH